MLAYVLDTSALMAVFDREEGAVQVLQLVKDLENPAAPRVYLPFMSLMEFEYVALRRFGDSIADQALRIVRSWPVELRESSLDWGSQAAWVKLQTSLSVADAWNAALALMLDAELVHKDPEFDGVPGLRHRRLPYKKA